MNFPVAIVPGAREPGMLTTFGNSWTEPTIPDGPSTMDAVTIDERRREGGGAPSQRRPVRASAQWTGPRGRIHEFLLAMRVPFAWRFRTRHV